MSYILLVFYGYGGFSPWLILFFTSFAVAFWEYGKVYKKVVAFSRKTGAPENVVMKFDGGFLINIFGIKKDAPMISPFKHRSQKNEPTKPILIFGFTAMFLPLIVGMILELAMS